MPQESTEEEQQLAAKEPTKDHLGEDMNATPADQFDQTPKDPPLLEDTGGFETVLDNDLRPLELNEAGPDAGEEV
jgi:hypothetical protein